MDDWLAGFGIPAMAPRHATRAEWPPVEAGAIELLASLVPENLPVRLRLDERATVTDPGQFLASLRTAVAAWVAEAAVASGPGVDLARNGCLQADLAALSAAVTAC